MIDDIGLIIKKLSEEINDRDLCLNRLDSIMNLSLSSDSLVFLAYIVNQIFLCYLDSINKTRLNDKYRNDEINKMYGIDIEERKKIIFTLSMTLYNLFKDDEVVFNSNQFLLLKVFVKNFDHFYCVDISNDIDIVEVPNSVSKNDSDLDDEDKVLSGSLVSFDNNQLEVVSNSDVVEKKERIVDTEILETSDDITVFENNRSQDEFKDIRSDVSDINNLSIKYIILLLLFLIVIFILYIVFLNINKKNYLISSKIDNLLGESSVIEKRNYVDDLKSKASENRDILFDYNNQIYDIDKQIAELNTKNEELANSVILKQNDLNKKVSEYESLKQKYIDISTYMISGVNTFNQYPNYPNGCEGVALYILLRYYNVDVSVDSIMDNLPTGDTPHEVDGVWIGGDPNYEFLGDPRSDDGWGIYDQGLSVTANKFKSGIINGTGMDFNNIIDLIRSGRPVIVWTSIDLKNSYVSSSWISDKTGDIIYWKRHNHAVVVIGYNDYNIIVSDPINGQIRYFDKDKFISIYEFMGRRALYY